MIDKPEGLEHIENLEEERTGLAADGHWDVLQHGSSLLNRVVAAEESLADVDCLADTPATGSTVAIAAVFAAAERMTALMQGLRSYTALDVVVDSQADFEVLAGNPEVALE